LNSKINRSEDDLADSKAILTDGILKSIGLKAIWPIHNDAHRSNCKINRSEDDLTDSKAILTDRIPKSIGLNPIWPIESDSDR
jgi:hypothetical protein